MSGKQKIRVLVVDDSFFMKKLLRQILESDSSIEVVGEASNGVEAVGQAIILKPNVITMDYNLPLFNGAEAVKKILADNQTDSPAIVMISAYTKEGSNEALECLKAGAVELIAKPSGELSINIDSISSEILAKVHAASHAKVNANKPFFVERSHKKVQTPSVLNKIIVIGSSTGGPPVVENIMAGLPGDLRAAILLAQHLPQFFISRFTEHIKKEVMLLTSEVTEGMKIEPGKIFVMPNSFQVEISENNNKEKIFKLTKRKISKDLSPSINNIMVQAAQNFGEKVVGIILTGMGNDGTKGIQAIKKAGGHCIVQDPTTCVVDSMPMSIISHHLADEVLNPKEIVQRISQLSL